LVRLDRHWFGEILQPGHGSPLRGGEWSSRSEPLSQGYVG
jgi:hypothetical protein